MLSAEDPAETVVDVVIMWPPTGPDGFRGMGGTPGFAVSNDVSLIVDMDVRATKPQKILEIHNFAFLGEEYIHFIRGMRTCTSTGAMSRMPATPKSETPRTPPTAIRKYGPFSDQYSNHTAAESPVISPIWDSCGSMSAPDSYGPATWLFTHRIDLSGETEYESYDSSTGRRQTMEDESSTEWSRRDRPGCHTG